MPEIDGWYRTIQKPSFNPPPALFGPVWTTLYVLMGIASYLVWQRRKQIGFAQQATAIYVVQLLLNLAWTFIFFSFHEISLALADILLLLAAIIINAAVFYRVHKWAGLLFIPYILWVGFAAALNWVIFLLN